MKSSENMEKILEYIDAHLEEDLTIGQLADEAGYSQYHFMRRFKAHTGMSAGKYLCRRRLIKASEEIRSGGRIIDAAIKYGWQSHSGFTKAFEREFGFCPSLLSALNLSETYLGGNSMEGVFLENAADGMTKEELMELLWGTLKETHAAISRVKLEQVYLAAEEAYQGVRRYSGEEYITHLLHTAVILAELEADPETVLAGLLCDAGKKGVLPMEELQKRVPEGVFQLVCESQREPEELSGASDAVLLIKLAERLHNMRTLQHMDASVWKKKAGDTAALFLPLARRVGDQRLTGELNALTVKYLARDEI